MKPQNGNSHDIFGAPFSGTPSHHRVLKPPGGGTSDLFTPVNGEEEKRIPQSISPSNQEPSVSNGVEKHDGNPVTGEGYDLAKSASQNSAAAPAAPSKTRVPPGGYSSGLW